MKSKGFKWVASMAGKLIIMTLSAALLAISGCNGWILPSVCFTINIVSTALLIAIELEDE